MTMHWTTLITTTDYASGVICLAHSLEIVKSKAELLCYVSSEAVKVVIEQVALNNGRRVYPTNLRVEVLSGSLYDDVFSTDLQRDHSEFIDAPRRFLFLQGTPFIFLDADMIITQNIDDLFDLLVPGSASTSDIIAVPNFRNKKKGYGDAKGNFNAGMMVVPNPRIADYQEMIRVLNAGYNDTEEKLLNQIFRDRWTALPIGYNCQKRAFKMAPHVWNNIRDTAPGIKVVHYVGGKPWQSAEEIRRLDWEGSSEEAMAPYGPLFELWHQVYRGEIVTAEDLQSAVPTASVVSVK
jgi:hypothetical protein